MAKASEAGSKMMYHQFVYEAPPLFLIFQAFFQQRDFFAVENAALQAGVSKDEW